MGRERRIPLLVMMGLALLCLCAVAVMAKARALEYSLFQQRVLTTPEDCDLVLGGGRGGSKTFCIGLLILRYGEQHGLNGRTLVIRQTYKSLADMELLLLGLFSQVYAQNFSYNRSEHVFRLPNGAYIELGQLETSSDYAKYQGRSFGLLVIDEAGQWSDPALLDMLRSNLRGPEGVPTRVVMAANPGGPGHHWLAKRYVFRGAPWKPFYEPTSGREWIYCPSTYVDNPFIDQEDYRKQIEAATATDPELGRAWLEGDWTVARGAFFGSVLSQDKNCIETWPTPKDEPHWWAVGEDVGWIFELAYDHGSSAPAVCYVIARSPGGPGPDSRVYPRDSIILIDELATNEPGSLTKGMGYLAGRIADEIIAMCERWNIEPEGVADDAIFAQHGSEAVSIAQEFRNAGVYFTACGKGDRLAGWERMRRLLADAGKPDVPGLFISRTCQYFWTTVPYLARDPRRVEDLDSRGPDHAADAARYACIAEPGEDFEPRPVFL